MTVEPAGASQSPRRNAFPDSDPESRLRNTPADSLELLKANICHAFPVPETHRFDDLLAAINNAENKAGAAPDKNLELLRELRSHSV